MILFTVIVSYQRLWLLERTVDSYLDTVSVPHELLIVDNGSEPDVLDWIRRRKLPVVELGANRYPGYACNRGFECASDTANVLHRSDSDIEYLPGWCENAYAMLELDARTAIVGLRTDEEELHTKLNTGGTAVIARHAWDAGLRYVETPWVDDMTEDWRLCQDALRMGFRWTRVDRPSVIHLGADDAKADDPYYQRSFGDRGIAWMLE